MKTLSKVVKSAIAYASKMNSTRCVLIGDGCYWFKAKNLKTALESGEKYCISIYRNNATIEFIN